jgi:TolA-binding protein
MVEYKYAQTKKRGVPNQTHDAISSFVDIEDQLNARIKELQQQLAIMEEMVEKEKKKAKSYKNQADYTKKRLSDIASALPVSEPHDNATSHSPMISLDSRKNIVTRSILDHI